MSGSSRLKNSKQGSVSPDQRRKKTQQIVFNILAVIIIISWIVSLFVNI